MSVRTSKPANTSKYYLTPSGGGYNQCILGNASNPYNKRPTKYSVLPNCVGYAYGRYLEYHGLTKANLPTCNAKDWYATAKKNGFKCSTTPSVGSVICFKGTTYGHVAFVERIESNGDLYLSESNWGHEIFRNVTVRKANGYNYSNSLKLVGFIANPAAKTEPAPAPLKTTTTTTSKSKTGDYKVMTNLLYVRTGPGTNYTKKSFEQFTDNAQKSIKKLNGNKKADGFVKGVIFTANEVKGNWGRCPSGWVCLDYCQRV